MTSKFSIDNRELLQRISSGEAVVGIDFGNLIIRELAAFRLAAMDSETDCKERKLFCSTDTARMRKAITVSAGTDVAQPYRHAQPPMVPGDVLNRLEHEANHVTSWHHMDEHSCKVNRRDLLTLVNACRAAMLQELQKSAGTEAICRSEENVQVLHTKSPAQSDCCPAQNQGWIPVSERMPEKGQAVLVYRPKAHEGGDSDVRVAVYGRHNFEHGFGCYWEPSHWMPLPAAPQEVKP